LLEQWIPFDLSNQACDNPAEQDDLANGRFGDWRRAARDWSIYNPDPDDYQTPGSCRRYVARCLNVGTRHRLLDEAEVRKAFDLARRKGAALMAFTDHDFRDIGRDVETVRSLLRAVAPDYPDVSFRYAEAREAMNRALWADYDAPSTPLLSAQIAPGRHPGAAVLAVAASRPTFGPQPFLALRAVTGEYHHDNLDFQEPFRRWTYVFDDLTMPWSTIDCLGVAANDQQGFPHVVRVTADRDRPSG
jgi:hypothetical protein